VNSAISGEVAPPDTALRKRILVDNPAKPYGFGSALKVALRRIARQIMPTRQTAHRRPAYFQRLFVARLLLRHRRGQRD
jgi:hypothetical protein